MIKVISGIRRLLVLMLVLCLVGCDNKEENREINFEAQYIRTDGSVDRVNNGNVLKIRSVDELREYYKDYKDDYDLLNSSTQSVSFMTAIDKYDESYFEKSFLLFILVEENSSDVYHRVISVSEDGEVLVDRNSLNNGNSDLAKWHIIVELDKEYEDIDYNVVFEKLENN